MRKVYFLLALFVATPILGLPHPQDVSADDVFGERNAGESYGTDSGGIDPDLVDELFGIDGQNANQQDEPYQEEEEEEPYVEEQQDEPYDEGQDANLVEDYEPPPQTHQNIDERSANCSFYEEDGYQCVPYYNCDELGEIITDGGPGLIDIRGNFGQEVLVDPENSKCEGYLEVCCRHPDFAFEPIKPKPKPYTSRCGNRNHNGIGVRIQNADKIESSTQFGEWPHMCALLENKDEKNLYVCGASLIAPGIVMTAAHCVSKFYDNQYDHKLKVRCGEWDTQKTVEPVEHQDRDVRYINMHPGFNPRNLTNNVALLHMKSEFYISAHVDTICLPSLDDLDHSYDWERCVATGWGKDEFGSEGRYQVIMKQVELDLVGSGQCQSALRTTRLGGAFRLDSTALCAGGKGGVDACKGDGGGPLVCPVKGQNAKFIEQNGGDAYGGEGQNEPEPLQDAQYVQAGIVGWGVGCGEEGIPGVYTDVSDMLCFIDWATQCVEGEDVDPYGMAGQCGYNWADRELRRLTRIIKNYREQKENTTDRRTLRAIDKRLRPHLQYRQKLRDVMDLCGTFEAIQDNEDLDEGYEDEEEDLTDLSGYTRTGAEAKAAGEEEEE